MYLEIDLQDNDSHSERDRPLARRSLLEGDVYTRAQAHDLLDQVLDAFADVTPTQDIVKGK